MPNIAETIIEDQQGVYQDVRVIYAYDGRVKLQAGSVALSLNPDQAIAVAGWILATVTPANSTASGTEA